MGEEICKNYTSLLHHAMDNGTPIQPIYEDINNSQAGPLLDPLDILPILIPSQDDAAKAILTIIAKECSPREVIMAVQEALERLEMLFEDLDEDEQQDDAKPNAPLSNQLQLLIELLTLCMPRLDRRKRKASETIAPFLKDLRPSLQKASSHCTKQQGQTILIVISQLVQEIKKWCKHNSDNEDFLSCSLIVRNTIACAIEALHNCIDTSLAQRAFEHFFPRLIIQSKITLGWEAGENVATSLVNLYHSLPEPPTTSPKNTTALFFIAHSPAELASLTPTSLHDLVSPLISSLQSNFLLDEALAVLLYALNPKLPQPRPILPENVTHPLLAILPTLCSSHSDAQTRHQAYRILSLLLSSCPSEDRLVLLYDLATNEEFPQMRVGSIGLIKENIFEAIGRVDTTKNVFGREKVLDVLGDVLFRPRPPDLFGDEKTGKRPAEYTEVKDSMETTRLSECLGLYYAWLMRDVMNVTHIRDKEKMDEVNKKLLQPLKHALERWQQENADPKDIMPLISLQINLDRVLEIRDKVMVAPGSKWT